MMQTDCMDKGNSLRNALYYVDQALPHHSMISVKPGLESPKMEQEDPVEKI